MLVPRGKMLQVTMGIASLCGLALMSAGHAQALTEICPAQLEIGAVASDNHTARGPARLFGFALTAMGPRTVSGKLAFDTTGGWFTVDVPPTELAKKDRHYNGLFGRFTVPQWVSPIMYARFPADVTLNHSWLYSASAKGDGDFGWEKTGAFVCPPPPGTQNGTKIISIGISRAAGATQNFEMPAIDAKDVDALTVAPSPDARRLAAVASKPLETANCARPFADAFAKLMVVPAYPDELRGTGASRIVGLGIALNADGTLADSWVWAPTDLQPFDDAAVQAEQQMTFTSAISYCRAVPAIYNSFVMFNSSW